MGLEAELRVGREVGLWSQKLSSCCWETTARVRLVSCITGVAAARRAKGRMEVDHRADLGQATRKRQR